MSNPSPYQIIRMPETSQLFHWLEACESASIVGISGIGKSNLFNQMFDPEIQTNFLGPNAKNTLLVRVNLHYLPDLTNRSLYSLILEQLEFISSRNLTDQSIVTQIREYQDRLLDSGEDWLKIQRYFTMAMGLVFRDPQIKLQILFDQFDEFYAQAEGRIFFNLRGLREAFKNRLAYFVFTRLPLESYSEVDKGREEFIELVLPNVLWLKPYQRNDGFYLFERIIHRYHASMDEVGYEQIYQLSGGHAGLSRAILLHHINSGFALENDGLDVILQIPSIRMECTKIWESLDLNEKRVLKLSSDSITTEEFNSSEVRSLANKGILDSEGNFFSPLFKYFVCSQEAMWEHALYLDPANLQVWVFGKLTPRLTALEFRLLQCLHQARGDIVDHYELIQAGWPRDDPGGVSDGALAVAMSRIRRKIEPNPAEPRFLLTQRDYGYQLITKGT